MAPQKSFFGFTESTNNTLYKLLAIPFTIFLLSRLPDLPITNIFCGPAKLYPTSHAAPGECYWYLTSDRHYWGVSVHLASVLPAGLLAVLQFTPAVRSAYRRFHRRAGYAAAALGLAGVVSAWAITDTAFGGSASTVAGSLTVGAFGAFALCKGIAEARAKRIQSHRDWMLRAWMALGSILTLRVCMGPLLALVSFVPVFRQYQAIPCPVLLDMYKWNATAVYAAHPLCAPEMSGLNPLSSVVVKGNIASARVDEQAAALRSIFGTAIWMGALLHAVATETYIRWDRNKGVKGKGAPVRKVETKAE